MASFIVWGPKLAPRFGAGTWPSRCQRHYTPAKLPAANSRECTTASMPSDGAVVSCAEGASSFATPELDACRGISGTTVTHGDFHLQSVP